MPLAVYAFRLFPPGAVELELAGVGDLPAALRRAGLAQLLQIIPFIVAVLTFSQVVHRRRTPP